MCDFKDKQIKSFFVSCLLTIRGWALLIRGWALVNLTREGDFDITLWKKLTSPLMLYSFFSGDAKNVFLTIYSASNSTCLYFSDYRRVSSTFSFSFSFSVRIACYNFCSWSARYFSYYFSSSISYWYSLIISRMSASSGLYSVSYLVFCRSISTWQ